MPNGMQYDERGRPYFLLQDGSRSYVSPVAMGEQPPPDNTGIFHKAPEFNQHSGNFETPFDWGNLLSMGVAGGLGAGAASAAGLFGGGAGAGSAASAAPAASAGPTAAGAGTLASHSILPAGAMTGATVPGAAASGGGGMGGLLKSLVPGMSDGGFDVNDITKLLPLLAHFLGGGSGPNQQQEDIQNLTMQRMNAQNPLFEAASRLAFSRMPDSATQGLQPPRLGGS